MALTPACSPAGSYCSDGAATEPAPCGVDTYNPLMGQDAGTVAICKPCSSDSNEGAYTSYEGAAYCTIKDVLVNCPGEQAAGGAASHQRQACSEGCGCLQSAACSHA